MAQIKIYARRDALENSRQALSDAIHGCVVQHLKLPPEKRFHRFFALENDDFVFPADRSPRYTILEIAMMQGRSAETKRRLIRALFAELETQCAISPADLEVQITESPRENWGFRGMTGDEIALSYDVEI